MKVLKIFMLLIIFVVICSTSTSYASDPIGDIIHDAENFLNNGQNSTIINDDDMKQMSDDFFNVLFSIGIVIAVIVGLVIGMQYMMSSVEEKAKGKKFLVVYIIGCGVLFGAFGIWKIIVHIFNAI